MNSKMKWALTWAPEGKKIAIVEATTAAEARRKAPMPYKKYLGEIGVDPVWHCPCGEVTYGDHCLSCGESRKGRVGKWGMEEPRKNPDVCAQCDGPAGPGSIPVVGGRYLCANCYDENKHYHAKCSCAPGKPCPFMKRKRARKPRKNPRQAMTYGVLPKRQDFCDAFFDATGGQPTYSLVVKGKAPKEVATGDYTEAELWAVVGKLKKAWERGDEDAGDWASGILTTLGFEWV